MGVRVEEPTLITRLELSTSSDWFDAIVTLQLSPTTS